MSCTQHPRKWYALTELAGPAHQQGAALLIGLVLIVVLILLSLSYAQNAIIQQRLSGNFRDISLAFQSSEAGTRWGSAWLQSLGGDSLSRPFPCQSSCNNSSRVWQVGQYPSHPEPSNTFWSTARIYGVNPTDDISLGQTIPLVNSQPRFIMEEQYFRRDDLAGDPQVGVTYFRVGSLGNGRRHNSSAIVRSVVAKRFE